MPDRSPAPPPPPARRRGPTIALAAGLIVLTLVVGVAGAIAFARSKLLMSLPQLDGEARVAGLSAPVTVARDALGIPTITGATRADTARALGYLHAQDRYFQMDLARRRAAGELAEIIGPRAREADRDIRPHRFRAVAQHGWKLTAGADREVLQAYTDGVNAGLGALKSAPFEYLLLNRDPSPWRPEDSYLVVLSMFVTLQGSGPDYERNVALLYDVLPAPLADFLAPRGTEWDAPVVGDGVPTPPVPGPDVFDLRTQARVADASRLAGPMERDEPVVGSNNWAVAGSLAANGGAMVANDMHLAIRVPNTWYRAVLAWRDRSGAAHRTMGVTLPGVPSVVVGSNGHVAWGFTNTNGDWHDWVVIVPDAHDPRRYLTPDGPRPFTHAAERIRVKGEPDLVLDVKETIWGPVLERDRHGREWALRWVAHDADRLPGLARIETATTIEELFDAANGLGTPNQNMVVADRSGRIGWSIFGSIPRRVGADGRLPASWADGTNRWDGYLRPVEYPRIIAPAGGRLWTANNRVVGGEMLAREGEGNYDVGIRARLIRDRLLAQDRFTPKDLLSIQLEDSALFLARWRDLALAALTAEATAARPGRAEFRTVLADTWTGHASIGSAAYRLTREFRLHAYTEALGPLAAAARQADARFAQSRKVEGALWKLVTERPAHLLNPAYASWDDLVLAAIDATVAQLEVEGRNGPLAARTWGERNVAAIRHPLSGALPYIGAWLDMPATALPGDSYTPRMHTPNEGPSERMVVSPGHEEDGILHMPGGQSGHPMSPFYRAGHDAWVNGDPTPFLPGPTEHMLRMRP